MYQWVIFAHILGVFGFLLAHGAAAAVSFKLRGEHEVERVRALLDLSRGVTMIASVSLLVLIAAGIAAGFMGNWWGRYWIWVSLGVLILTGLAMMAVGSRPLNRIRQLVQASGPSPTETTQTQLDSAAVKQLTVMLGAIHPWLLTAIGAGGLTLILWLMMFKPF